MRGSLTLHCPPGATAADARRTSGLARGAVRTKSTTYTRPSRVTHYVHVLRFLEVRIASAYGAAKAGRCSANVRRAARSAGSAHTIVNSDILTRPSCATYVHVLHFLIALVDVDRQLPTRLL